MLDILSSPLRGYIAQNLQFYLSKYIEGIQLEGLGIFGGDLVLNDLEIKRDVLLESLEIPSSFDFSRGFIRELRIHIPWTQLLSQPIEVKLYTIELILTARSDADRLAKKQQARAAFSSKDALATGSANAKPGKDVPAPIEQKMDAPKSGWLHDSLQKILANISIQVNNLVLKYEQDDIVLSVALGTLDFYSASEAKGWKKQFEEPQGPAQAICKRIDVKDLTIFLDRYTRSRSDSKSTNVYRKVVGYEVPVLTRTSVSARAKILLKPKLAPSVVVDSTSSNTPTSADAASVEAPPRPSIVCDPFFTYSCNRSKIKPMYELDIFVNELAFSLSDRQLHMIAQLVKIASAKMDVSGTGETSPASASIEYASDDDDMAAELARAYQITEPKKASEINPLLVQVAPDTKSKGKESWFGWAMNALGGSDDDEEDALVSEIIAETKEALRRANPPPANDDAAKEVKDDGPLSLVSCLRVCIRILSLTLRKHLKEDEGEQPQEAHDPDSSTEELVPVANLGLVRVPVQKTRARVSRPAKPLCTLRLHYSALEAIFIQGTERKADLVFEIERVELLLASDIDQRGSDKKVDESIFHWGSIDTAQFSDCVSHPYFINSFYGEESRQLNQRETRSFELVKVSFDTEIPVWKTLESHHAAIEEVDVLRPCECAVMWKGEIKPCTPTAALHNVCEDVSSIIGLKERVLGEELLEAAVTEALKRHQVPIQLNTKLQDKLLDAAREYRQLRSSDLGATENMKQLLEPQLFALLSQQALHFCGAESLASSCLNNDIRRRSVHSAVRLRHYATRNTPQSATTNGTSVSPDTLNQVSRVLDLSLGQAEGSFDPHKYDEVIDLVACFISDDFGRRSSKVEAKAPLNGKDTPKKKPADNDVKPDIDDIKLVTFSKLSLSVSNSQINKLGTLTLLVRDAVYSDSRKDGEVAISAFLGEVSVGCVSPSSTKIAECLSQVLGATITVRTDQSSGQDSTRSAHIALDKLMVKTSDDGLFSAMLAVNELLRSVGKPLLISPEFTPQKRSRTFWLEVCNASVTGSHSSTTRLYALNRRALEAEVGSLSLASSMSSDLEQFEADFQSGFFPLGEFEGQTSTPFLQCRLKEDKSPGSACIVPMLPRSLTFESSGNVYFYQAPVYTLRVSANLAEIDVNLKALADISAGIARLQGSVKKSWAKRQDQQRELTNQPPNDELHNAARPSQPINDLGVPAKWQIVVDLTSSEGIVHVNEMLVLTMPAISVTSPEMQSIAEIHEPGGHIALSCNCGDFKLSMGNKSKWVESTEQEIFRVGGLSGQLTYDHQVIDDRHIHDIQGSVRVPKIRAEVSRLAVHCMLNIPFPRKRKAKMKSTNDQSTHEKRVIRDDETLAPSQWSCKVGVQLDEASVKLCGDIQRTYPNDPKVVEVDVIGVVSNASAAIRVGNHRPVRNVLPYQIAGKLFNDVQVCVFDVAINEVVHYPVKPEKARFGDFILLPVHCLSGTMLCLDDADLISMMDAFRIPSSHQASSLVPSPMLTWQLTSQIVKAFRMSMSEANKTQREPVELRKSMTKAVTIPLLSSWNNMNVMQNPRSSPLLSIFVRNYGETADDQHVIAASMESIDVVLTTSSLHCVTSILDACVESPLLSTVSPEDYQVEEGPSPSTYAKDPADEQMPRAATTLENIQVSLFLGQLRLILPNESLSEAIALNRAACPGNVLLVIESSSVFTSAWNEINLDGLGYPPFNATRLPRRQKSQSQRLGDSTLRLGCKVGNVFGAVADIVRADGRGEAEPSAGIFEAILSQTNGTFFQMHTSGTFLFPFNAALDVEEAHHAPIQRDDMTTKKRRAALSITKARIELQKSEFDAIVGRSLGASRAMLGVLRSPIWRTFVDSTRRVGRVEKESIVSHQVAKAHNVVHEVTCDGIEVALSSTASSIHARIGSMSFYRNFLDRSGGFSIQNVVTGFRCAGDPSCAGNLASREELVFGANADPALWQLGPDNYPEKLLSGRWSSLDGHETTLFLDMQAYQLHLSCHLLEQVSQFVRFTPAFLFTRKASRYVPLDKDPSRDVYRCPKHKTTVKILIAPSVISLWTRNESPSTSPDVSTSVWLSCGQTFVSVGIGADEANRQKLVKANQDAVHELNRYFSVQDMDFMFNLEKIAVKTSSRAPVLGINFRYGTVGSLPSHIVSNWGLFSRHLHSGSAKLQLLEDCGIHVTGDRSTMIERPLEHNESEFMTTSMSKINLQGEISALRLKISSSSVASLVGLMSALQRSARAHSKEQMVLPRVKNLVESSPTIVYRGSGVSTDDFNYLSRMAGARHPAPGELVLTESLFIETGLSTDAGLPPSQTKTTVQVDEIDFTTYDHIQEEDLLSFMDEVNSLWESDDPEAQSEAPSLPGVENKTRSWMGMRWCYHIPRVINEIVANPVPIPPTDVPNGWPTWQSNAESGSARLCDIYCQLRCWDYRHNRFVTISDFFVPWEQSNNPKYRMDAADLYESGTFGDFVAQWFDADLEEYEYHAKLLELASATRRIQIHDVLPSDKWELRWRSPISIDKDAEHKQTRLLVNALLASSVQVKSTLVTQAYQNALVSISSPQMTLSLCQISFFDYAHEVMSVSLTDTTVSLTKYGADHPELDVTLSTSLQVYVQNFVQLLNASVLPRVSIHGMIHSAQDSLTISTVVDPVALYLNHTTMLIISTMDKILTQRAEDKVQESAKQTSLLYDMRIILINETSHPIWYRQEGTYECLQVNANSRAAYSWLSLAYNPYYRMEFALEKTTQDETINSTEGVSREDSAWSDPCVIKENCITGRYFKKFGFLWVCVELRGMQTLVTLRPPVIFRNFSDSLVHLILNDEQQVKYACSGLDSSLEQGTSRREADSCPSQNTAHIMADTVSTFRVSRSGNLWSAPLIVKDLPAEFDLVKLRNDNRADVDKRAGLSAVELRSAAKFVVLHIEDADAVPFYGWIVAHRAECKAVLPNEFDPNQRQFTQRYGWMEAALWPAFTIENTADVAVTFSFQQKKKAMSIEVGACSKEAVSEINPFEASDIEVQRVDSDPGNDVLPSKWKFPLLCSREGLSAKQSFDFGDLRVSVLVASDPRSHHPSKITIRIERSAVVQNHTDSAMQVRIRCPPAAQPVTLSVAANKECQLGILLQEKCVAVEIGVPTDTTSLIAASENDSGNWSSEVRLLTEGDLKPCIISSMGQSATSTLASSFLIELKRENERCRISIHPQVVMLNSTGLNLKILPTSSDGTGLVHHSEAPVLAGDDSAWCMPVCLQKSAKKRSIASDVTSWLSSTFSKRPSEDIDVTQLPQPATISCSFRVSLDDVQCDWTEAINVKLPDLSLLVKPDGAVDILEKRDAKTPRGKTERPLYASPSSLTHRHRLLIHQKGSKHRMLTFTMARVANSIHVLFFIDHQSPVVLHNQWDHELGFRIVSSPSFPEAVGAQHYMEYDWRLQSRRNQSLRKGEGDENGSASTLKDWLTLSNIEAAYNASNTDVSETVRFQIGSPTCGWSNTLWQVGGIQFATFSISDDSEELPRVPSFLVMCSQRAGTWYISITCLEDPLRSSTTGATENLSTRATFAVSSMQRQRPRSLNICFSIAELRFHCCDEFDPVRDGRGLIQYPEIFRLSCSSSTVVFSTSADPPESARYSDRLGYLSHVRAYSTLLISIENMELDHFLQDCNFPVILSFPGNEERHAKREIMELELASKHTALQRVVSNLLEKQMPLAQANCLVGRIIFVDTWDRDTIPAFFHSIEVRTLPAVLQVEDAILSYVHGFAQPLLDAITGAKVTATALTLSRDQASDTASGTKKNSSSRTHQSLSAMSVTRQRKLFIELLEIGDVEVTVTARVSIPILNSFDGTPVRFGTTQMRNVFAFPDQLYKDLAADYVADAIVRSPMLLMSLNIIGNPAGFFRNVGTGVRDLFEIPLAAAKDGYNPWILTKGVVGGVSSFFGHTTAAALTSLSGFSYSISRTMEQLTLPSEQLKKRHYARPTHLSSALADGLGSLGSSVVGAATGVITTPMAIYKERQQQGLETKFGDVVGGVGMGLVGIVARPMGGVASLVSIASDGILYGSGMGDSRHLLPFDDMQLASRFDARPNEVLRYKLKVLSDVVGDVVYAHGVWVAPSEKLLAVEESGLHYLPERLSIELSTSKKESSNVEMDNAVQKLLLADDHKSPLVPVTVLASNQYLYIIGECGSSKQVVIAKTPLIEVNAVEENLTEPSKLDFGIWRSSSIQWLRFRLVPSQRRQLSHQVRLWMVETQF